MDSTALQVANERLLALRAWVQAHKELPATGHQSPGITLPEHLGWDSPAVTAVLRRKLPVQEEGSIQTVEPTPAFNDTASLPDEVKVYPDIALGILRGHLAASGRIWLLLKGLEDGRGWVEMGQVRELFTDKPSAWWVCSDRQLRNVLGRGEGIFWRREGKRLWLRAAGKVAADLGVEKLRGHPVAVPAVELVGSLSQAKAHLLTSFHSGRRRETLAGVWARPISRACLERLSRVGRRSQRAYEVRGHTAVRTNIAIGGAATDLEREQRAWEQGTAVFELKDTRGKQGTPGRVYLAWQLPNSYDGRHRQLPRGQQRKINKKLADLLNQRTTGNGQTQMTKRYCANGKQAVRVFEKQEKSVYWQRSEGRYTAVWQVMG